MKDSPRRSLGRLAVRKGTVLRGLSPQERKHRSVSAAYSIVKALTNSTYFIIDSNEMSGRIMSSIAGM